MPLRRYLFILCALSLLGRVAVALAAGHVDLGKYEQYTLAKNIASGHGFSLNWPYQPADAARAELWQSNHALYPGAFMPPIIPYIDALLLTLFGSIAWSLVIGLQCLVGAALPASVYAAAETLFGSDRIARWSALLSLLYVPALVASATLAASIYYVVAGLTALTLAARVDRHGFAPWYLGLVCGLLTLMRSEFLPLGIVLCGIAAFRVRSVAPLCSLCAIVAPWSIRNFIVMHHFVPVSSHPWREIWRGANPFATGSGYGADGADIWEGIRFPQITQALDRVSVSPAFEVEADQIFKREVLAFAESHKLDFAGLICRKVTMLWSLDVYYPKARSALYIVPTVLVELLFGGSLLVILRRRVNVNSKALFLFVLFWVFYTLIIATTYMLPRYQTYVFATVLPFLGVLLRRRSLAPFID
jgi:hypothetical protein